MRANVEKPNPLILAGYQIAIQVPLVTAIFVIGLSLLLGLLALLSGLDPLEYIWSLLQDTAVPISGLVIWAELTAASLIAIGCIVHWSFSQAGSEPRSSEMGSRLASILYSLQQPLSLLRRFSLGTLGNLESPRLRNRSLAATSASLCGADPLQI